MATGADNCWCAAGNIAGLARRRAQASHGAGAVGRGGNTKDRGAGCVDNTNAKVDVRPHTGAAIASLLVPVLELLLREETTSSGHDASTSIA